MKQTIINHMYHDLLMDNKRTNKEYSERYRVPEGTIRAYRNIASMLHEHVELEKQDYIEALAKRDNLIQTQRNVIEQLIKDNDEDIYYGIVF
jgi:CBS-domain-containing membrane protein